MNEQRRRVRQLLTVAGFAVVLVAALVVISQGGGSASGSAPAKGLLNGIDQQGTTLGDPKAPYTLVEYGDLQCPFCAEYDRDVLPTVINDYVRTGRLRLEFRPLTFIGPDSETAARFALALGAQNRFWNFADLMYHHQATENSGYVDPAYLAGLAGQIPGADAQRATAAAGSAAVTHELDAAKADAERSGITSTPSFLIGPSGGQLHSLDVSQLQPDAFRAAIDEAIGR